MEIDWNTITPEELARQKGISVRDAKFLIEVNTGRIKPHGEKYPRIPKSQQKKS